MNKNFTLLLTGQSLANIGDVLYMVALVRIVFDATGSAAAASFIPFTITLSMFTANLLMPLLLERGNLKGLLAGSQIGKTILLFLLCVLLDQIIYIFLIICLIALLDGCANPIRQTLIPHYVKEDKLLRANALAEIVTQLIQTIMWFLGSLALLILNPSTLIWGVGGLFAAASILLCLLRPAAAVPTETNKPFSQMKAGWQLLFRSAVLKRIAVMDLLETMAAAVWIAAILYIYVAEALQTGEQWWGYLNGAFFSGLIFGSLFCMRFGGFIERKISIFLFAGSLLSACITLLFGLTSIPAAALILSLLIGVFSQVKNIPQQTIIQRSVPQHQLAKVYSSLGAIGTGMFGISSLLIGVLADLFGVRFVFIFSGVLLFGVSLIVYRGRAFFAVTKQNKAVSERN